MWKVRYGHRQEDSPYAREAEEQTVNQRVEAFPVQARPPENRLTWQRSLDHG